MAALLGVSVSTVNKTYAQVKRNGFQPILRQSTTEKKEERDRRRTCCL